MAFDPPRSVYVAFEVFPRPKGASSHMAAVLTALARQRAPVWLLCCGFADMPGLQIEDGIVIQRCKLHHPNLLKRAGEFGNFVHHHLASLPEPPELLVFRDPWGGWPALQTRPDVPAIFEVNGLPSWELPYNYPAVARNISLQAKIEDVERFCLSAADRIITVSEVTKEALSRLGVESEKISVAPNSAPDVFFRATGDECPLEPLSRGRWFGYFGSLHPWQGVEVLIRAWARVAGEWPDARLLIVHNGRREPLKNLRKMIRKNGLASRVYLQSPLQPQILAQVAARLEFTCAPLTETTRNIVQGCCPIKIIESMAAGAPVLASNLRVNRALIRHGQDGFLVRPGDVRAWARAIQKMLGEVTYQRQLAEAARATARSRFTQPGMFDKLEPIFASAVRQAGHVGLVEASPGFLA